MFVFAFWAILFYTTNYVGGFAFRERGIQAQQSQDNTYSGMLFHGHWIIMSIQHNQFWVKENSVFLAIPIEKTNQTMKAWDSNRNRIGRAWRAIGRKWVRLSSPPVSFTKFLLFSVQLIDKIIFCKSISIYLHLYLTLYDGIISPVVVIWNFIELIHYIAYNKVFNKF